MRRFDVVIVGAGHAGAQTALALRQHKFVGSVAVVGDEPELPYERPPLSKDYLSGEKEFERILIRPPEFWIDRDIQMIVDQRVTAVNAKAHRLTTAAGEEIAYGTLVWATGGRARSLICSGWDAPNVHTVRTRADVDKMIQQLPSTDRVVVVGGGYIGLEAAAVLAKQGKRVTLLERNHRVLARSGCDVLSRFYEDEHRKHGVDVRLEAEVDCIETFEDRAIGVRMHGGEFLLADMVIVGIGIVPAVAELLAAGADGDNGVLVDGMCRTSLPDVYAVGDCALHANAFAEGSKIRLESVQNANDMANTAAREITTGAAQPYRTVPWFWSNQYDLRLQTVGLSLGHDRVVVRGEIASRSFTVIYLRRGRVIALDCVNSMKDYVQGRALVVDGAELSDDELRDTTLPLKEIWNRTSQESKQ